MKKHIKIILTALVLIGVFLLFNNKANDIPATGKIVNNTQERKVNIPIPNTKISPYHNEIIKENKKFISSQLPSFKTPLPERRVFEIEEINYTPAWQMNFKSPRKIDSRETFTNDVFTEFKRETLIEVEDMKYPFIRVVETFEINPETNEENLSSYTESVANHLIIEVADFSTLNAIRKIYPKVNFKKASKNTLIASFEKFNIDTVSNAINELSQVANVKLAEPDYLVHHSEIPDDSNFSQLWGIHNTGQSGGNSDADIDAVEAWDIQKGSRNIIVAVIDTGIDYNHLDLAANMWKNPGETGIDSNGNNKESNGVDDDGNGYIDDVYGYDFINNDSDPDDNDHYHGTHCAGTIGGVGNNGRGVTGVNWQVKMMAIKFLGPYGGYTSDAISSVEYATSMGAHLSSNSWGGGGFSQALKDAIDDAGSNGSLLLQQREIVE